MKTILGIVLSLSLLFPVMVQAESQDTQDFVIKVDQGTTDLHAVFMAMKVGTMLVEKKHNVTMFFNLESVRLLDKRQPLNLTWGVSAMNLEDLYNGFIAKGGKIVVCPHCAKVAGIEKANLREGSVIATDGQVAMIFVNADKVIDY
jgi:predicted peroxiredoxin